MAAIEVPFWMFLAVCLLALIGFIDRIFSPAVRWFFRRKVNAVIDELNTRLPLKIQPFKLTQRQVLIDRLTNDPSVLAAAEIYAKEEGVPIEVAADKARVYAREIVPSFNAYAYFKFGTKISKLIATSLYRVRLGYADTKGLSDVPPNASIVFVMNHRSNMDYLLVTYLASTSTTLSYAVGEWARIAGLTQLVRAMGAYFIRRKSRGSLYRKVLARYVQMATEAGVPQAIFPEGGLSRDGLLQPAKLGLLAYVANAWHKGGHDIVFVPVGINYDRVLEDRTLTGEKNGKKTKLAQTFGGAAFILKNIGLRMVGRWYRFGYAAVSFGPPVSLTAFLSQEYGADFEQADEDARNATITKLGDTLMEKVGAQVPVLPVSLVATLLLEHPELDELALKAKASELMARLESSGAYVHIPRANRDYAIAAGLRMLVLRRIVVLDEGHYKIADTERDLAQYYANAIVHLG